MENGSNGNAPSTKQDISDLKKELSDQIRLLGSTFNDRITQVRDELTEKMRDIETNMLTEFHRYAKGISHRLHGIETADSDI